MFLRLFTCTFPAPSVKLVTYPQACEMDSGTDMFVVSGLVSQCIRVVFSELNLLCLLI